MKIDTKKLLKDGVLDLDQIFDSKGKIIRAKVDAIAKEFPIMPSTEGIRAGEYSIKKNRLRKPLPDRLPTFGMDPLPVDEHQLIGEYESKQNLYLIMAHAYNRIMDRLDKLQ